MEYLMSRDYTLKNVSPFQEGSLVLKNNSLTKWIAFAISRFAFFNASEKSDSNP
jgi:hypothetical protein